MRKLFLALPLLLSLALVACSSDDGDPEATPPPSQGVATATRGPGTPAASPTTVGTSAPPVDGTVAPQNAGATDPVTIKSNPDPINKTAILKDVRVGAHPENGGWDRIVFEFTDVLPPGDVSYVPEVISCGPGEKVPVQGTAVLQVRFTTAQAHTDAGAATLMSNQIVGPGNVILESKQSCDFEAHVTWAIGLKAKKNFKVTMLSNPTRVVIDVKQ